MKKSASVAEIAKIIKGEVSGEPSTQIHGLETIESAKEGQMAFVFSKKHLKDVEGTDASCVVVPQEFDLPSKKTLIKTANPREAFINLLTLFYKPERKKPSIHKQAAISEAARLGKNIYAGPFVTIEDGAAIGDDCAIEAGVFIGKGTTIGSNTTIHPNVTIYHNCIIGNNVIIHAGTVIGSDGFGYIEKEGLRHKIPQTGRVVIKDDVELGSNVSVDRATVGETVIGEGTKIDNIVQIAHNVKIGKNVVIAGESGIAGSTVVEDNVTIAAQVGIKDHIRIGKGAIIAAKSAVKDDVPPGAIIAGIPAKDGRETARELAAVKRLTKNINKIFQLLRQE